MLDEAPDQEVTNPYQTTPTATAGDRRRGPNTARRREPEDDPALAWTAGSRPADDGESSGEDGRR